MKNKYFTAGLILLIVLWAGCGLAGFKFMEKKSLVGIRFLEEGASKDEIEEASEAVYAEGKQDLSLSAWAHERNLLVEVPQTGGSSIMDGIVIYGDSSAAVAQDLESGVWKAAYDKEGCMLSEGAAYRLFGSIDVTGLKVICQGKEWTIRGVLHKKTPWIMLPAQKDAMLPYMEINFYGEDSPVTQAQSFLTLNGMTGDYVMFDWPLLKAAVRVFICIPGWVLGAVLLCRWKIKYKWIFGIAAVSAGIYLTLRLPGDWIPTRWSDFSFWIGKFEYLGEMVRNLWQARLYDVDLQFAGYFFLSGALSLSASVGLLAETLALTASKRKK